jgi:carbonic anhydrase
MRNLEKILENNRQWVEKTTRDSPDFFGQLAEKHAPELLWIGCSDGRVSPDQLTRLPLGKIFVHRNVGNVFASNDLNCLAVLQFAVDELKVPDIVICGHYDCGGINRALNYQGHTPIDLWVDQIRNVHERFHAELETVDDVHHLERFAELNVSAQVHNICRSSIVRNAWDRGQKLSIHGLMYSMDNGMLKSICPSVSSLKGWESFQSTDVINTNTELQHLGSE